MILICDIGSLNKGSARIYVRNLTRIISAKDECCEGYVFSKLEEIYDVINAKAPKILLLGKGVGEEVYAYVRKKYPEVVMGRIHPNNKQQSIYQYIQFGIFGSSIELDYYQSVTFEKFLIPQFEYIDFDEGRLLHKEVNDIDVASELNFVWHGDRGHLASFPSNLIYALNNTSKIYNIKIIFIYNGASIKPAKISGLTVKQEHIEWSFESIHHNMMSAHVGIVTSLTKVSRMCGWLNKYSFGRQHNYSDLVIRFKNCSNSARAVLFYQYAVPAVFDMSPDHFMFNASPGLCFSCHSKAGWKDNISRLINDSKVRLEAVKNGQRVFCQYYDPIKTVVPLIEYLSSLNEK
jgi:hypothetical protein